jgi:hypothetical protein
MNIKKHPTTWAELKAAMRRRFESSYYARNAEREVQGHRSKIYSNSFAGSGRHPVQRLFPLHHPRPRLHPIRGLSRRRFSTMMLTTSRRTRTT